MALCQDFVENPAIAGVCGLCRSALKNAVDAVERANVQDRLTRSMCLPGVFATANWHGSQEAEKTLDLRDFCVTESCIVMHCRANYATSALTTI